MGKDFGIIVLISGRGSNLKSLIDRRESFSILATLSNKPEAPGLEYAQAAGIPIRSFDRRDYPSLPDMKAALLEAAQESKPSLVVLAGFMQIIEPDFLNAFPNKIVNIHPSLLPAYPGIDTHARALAAGEKRHGCSVHLVDAGVDTGTLIAQASCDCLPDDDEASLAARVLKLEHNLFPWVINAIAKEDIILSSGRPRYSVVAKAEAKAQNFTIFP